MDIVDSIRQAIDDFRRKTNMSPNTIILGQAENMRLKMDINYLQCATKNDLNGKCDSSILGCKIIPTYRLNYLSVAYEVESD